MKTKTFRIDDEFNRLLKIYCANVGKSEQEVIATAVWEYIHKEGTK